MQEYEIAIALRDEKSNRALLRSVPIPQTSTV